MTSHDDVGIRLHHVQGFGAVEVPDDFDGAGHLLIPMCYLFDVLSYHVR